MSVAAAANGRRQSAREQGRTGRLSPPIAPTLCGSRMFHVKHRNASTPSSKRCCSGSERPSWSPPRRFDHLWTRHIADSLQLVPLAPEARVWLDLGSGGGFPGIPIACALAGQPGAMVHLVESNGKKAAFLREAIRVTGVPAEVHQMRAEDYGDSSSRIGRCGHRAGAGAAKNTLRSCGTLDREGRGRLVSQGSRCRCRIDRSY